MDIEELELVRGRWRRERNGLLLLNPGEEGFAGGGMAHRVPDLSTRLVILPGDPELTPISFDGEFWTWWGDEPPSPFPGRANWGLENKASVEAALRFRTQGDVWSHYVALPRHGGLEVAFANAYEVRTHRTFPLVQTVGLLWSAFSLQAHANQRFSTAGPWEVTLAFVDTENSYLGNLATGWEEADYGWTPDACQERNVLIRRELDVWPDDTRDLAFSFGGFIEDAWGFQQRRFLARQGELSGEFDSHVFRR